MRTCHPAHAADLRPHLQVTDADVELWWPDYKAFFHKRYPTAALDAAAKALFKDSMQQVFSTNRASQGRFWLTGNRWAPDSASGPARPEGRTPQGKLAPCPIRRFSDLPPARKAKFVMRTQRPSKRGRRQAVEQARAQALELRREEQQQQQLAGDGGTDGRTLQQQITVVDWRTAGKVSAIRDQGE